MGDLPGRLLQWDTEPVDDLLSLLNAAAPGEVMAAAEHLMFADSALIREALARCLGELGVPKDYAFVPEDPALLNVAIRACCYGEVDERL